MRAILPGRPQSKRQALCTAHWDGLRLIAYISGNTAIILRSSKDIVQTISIDHVEDLTAITIDEASGRLAICNGERVIIFDAVGREENDLRWTQTYDIAVPENGKICSLSWGASEEILVAGSQLWLYHVPYSDDSRLIWQQAVANDVAIACFSNDGELIASCGHHDRLVKIWRRLSFELDSTRFDVSYLPHPAAVTDLRWRKPWHNEQSLDALLYTFCADNQIRVWTYCDPHSMSVVQLIATIDANISIEPRRRSVGSFSRKRYVYIIDSRDFSQATEKAIQQAPGKQVDHALEHLVEIANRSPEICVVLDGLGHMSVWGVENAGCKTRKPTIVFNVTLVDDVDVQLSFPHGAEDDYTTLCAFAGGSSAATLSLLVHSYTGQVDWYESSITDFFDTSSRKNRIRLVSSWSGHDIAIDHIARGLKGDSILSWTDEGQAILWSQSLTGSLRRQCEINTEHEILSVILLGAAGHLLVLHLDSISLWDVRNAYGTKVDAISIDAQIKPLSIQRVSPALEFASKVHFILCFEDSTQETWQARLPSSRKQPSMANGSTRQISKLPQSRDELDRRSHNIPCDVGSSLHGLQPQQLRVGRVCIDADCHVESFSTTLNTTSEIPIHKAVSTFTTNIQNVFIARASSSGKCALLAHDRKTVTIWELNHGVCEWQYEHDGIDEIRKLAWTSTPRGNLFLFIGFSHHAIIVGQFRYPAISIRQSPWYITQHISLRGFTTIHINDVCWLSSGDLVVAAGNQIFVLENNVTKLDSPILQRSQQAVKSESAAAIVDMANSIVPIFHPDFLEALNMQSGLYHAERILKVFHEKLKYFADGDTIPSDLNLSEVQLLLTEPDNRTNGHIATQNGYDDDVASLEDIENTFIEYLDNTDIWQIGPKKRQSIATVFTNLCKVGRLRNSLDENALRYLYALYSTPVDQDLPWRAYVFASRSTSQEALVDLVVQHHDGKLNWKVARRTGLFIWLNDVIALQTQLENVARAEYTQNENRNPVDCSLYYFALNKKQVLQGLWRMTYGNREKENTLKLLANNFDEPRWKATALKNAYALLSKRRFAYGAAFFLLGGSLKDAVNVCVNQLHDIQLAITLARAWTRNEQQSHEVLEDTLRKHILKMSIDHDEGRWMAAWAYSTLSQPAQALQSLVRPLHQVNNTDLSEFTGPVQSMSYRANDPNLSILYYQLRSTLIKQNKWTTDVLSPREEWNFVIRTASWWARAGMDYLAVKMLREWEFIPYQTPRQGAAPTTLVARPDIVTEEMKGSKEDEVKEVKKKPAPTQFVEPSADDLLGAFGF